MDPRFHYSSAISFRAFYMVLPAHACMVYQWYPVPTCNAHIWAHHHALGILSLVQSYPVWSRTMTARHDLANSYSGTALSSEFPAWRQLVEYF